MLLLSTSCLVVPLSASGQPVLTQEALSADAMLAEAVYDLNRSLSGGWRLFDTSRGPARIDNPDGFQAGVYERPLSNGQREIRVVFAGTNDRNDWVNNLAQGIAAPAPASTRRDQIERQQYAQAQALAAGYVHLAKNDSSVANIRIIGHSRGGALAQFVAGALDVTATTFNSASLAKAADYMSDSQRRIAHQRVNQYVLDGDPVFNMTSALPGATQYGRIHEIRPALDVRRELFGGPIVSQMLETHSMERVRDALRTPDSVVVPVTPMSRAQADRLVENVAALSTVMTHLGGLDERFNDAVGTAQDLFDLGRSLGDDLDAMGDHNFALITSNTLETAGKLTLGRVLDRAGSLPDLGAIDFVDAAATHIGSGRLDIDTIESYLVGLNKLAWGALGGRLTGSAAGAKKWQEVGDALRVLGGTVVLDVAQNVNRARNAPTVEQMYRTAQLARIHHGQDAQSVEDFLTLDVARQSFSQRDIQRLNAEFSHAIPQSAGVSVPAARHYSMRIEAGQSSGFDSSNGDAMHDLTRRANRTVVFGSGDAAQRQFDRQVARIGERNVLWVRHVPSTIERNAIAGRFGADATMTIRQTATRHRVVGGLHEITPLDPTDRSSIRAPEVPIRSSLTPVEIARLDVASSTTPIRGMDLAPATARSWAAPDQRQFEPMPSDSGVSTAPITYSSSPAIPSVGGVFLTGQAEVSASGASQFSLLLENTAAGMDVLEFRKFLTALWAVYFSEDGVGISIDPISPDIDQHLVRYIGHVMHSDLGRVMREADYRMKRWSIGTDRPDLLSNFRNPDDIAGEAGRLGPMAWSRFWFVPEGMRFYRSDNMLLFDGGRMTLKTEYLSPSRGGRDRNNEQFAQEFTDSYAEVAARYPVFRELFDYAKLVSLSAYLKESGVPLLSYLLANKELILSENSPELVDALAARSAYFENVEITGGVNLMGADAVTQQQLFSASALNLPARFYAGVSSPGTGVPGPMSFAEPVDLFGTEYSVVSPAVLSVAADDDELLGIQTDIAMRADGEPGIEIARYYDEDYDDVDGFGNGWHLAIPHRVLPADDDIVEFSGVSLPQRMIVENRLSGRQEVLQFSDERYVAPGYVPTDESSSAYVGLFLMSDGSYRLVDKIGSEFEFDPTGRMTMMAVTEDYVVEYEYGWEAASANAPGVSDSIALLVGNAEAVESGNLVLPGDLVLTEATEGKLETFVFDSSDELGFIGWVPTAGSQSAYDHVALMSDASFQIETREGKLIRFDAGGRLDEVRGMVVKRIIQGEHVADFTYAFADDEFRATNVQISGTEHDAATGAQPLYQAEYLYDEQGLLAQVDRPGTNWIRGGEQPNRVAL